MRKTAEIIIIGDEILSGRVEDANSPFIAKELRKHGVELKRIVVIPDDIEEIATEVKTGSTKFDFVFTSGGVGPTHDDVTMEAIAKAFGVEQVINEELKEFLVKKYGENLNSAHLKMVTIPAGAQLLKDKDVPFPLIVFKNIYIFPGIPKYLREKFKIMKKLFPSSPLYLKKIYLLERESVIALVLNKLVSLYQEVKFGSYPAVDCQDYRVMVTLESSEQEILNHAVQEFLAGFSQEKIVRVV